MSWIQPAFSDFPLPPKKKQRLDCGEDAIREVTYRKQSKKKEVGNVNNSAWLERFAPKKPEDLAVHKKKVEEIENWLKALDMESNKSHILLLTGPSGCGKMTTVRVVCKSLGLNITEWINPVSSDAEMYTSQLKSFAEFVVRATRYKSVLAKNHGRRVVVIKDIPNIFFRDPTLFQECIKQYSKVDDVVLIFIVSDNNIARDLFPEDVKMEARIGTINFNPVTTRNVTLALTDILKKAKISGSADCVDQVSSSCGGDMRNAITTLHFLLDGGRPSDLKLNKKKEKGEETKDDTLDLFRGLGRILYSKRDPLTGKLVHNPEETASSFESCSFHFLSMLHENYPMTFTDLNSVRKATESLCVAEILVSDWREGDLSRSYGLAAAARGLAVANNKPLRRFQAFSRYIRPNKLMDNQRENMRVNFPDFSHTDLLVDGISYLTRIPFQKTDNQKALLKELNFVKKY